MTNLKLSILAGAMLVGSAAAVSAEAWQSKAAPLSNTSTSSATAISRSDAEANATGGNANIVVEGDRRFTPESCPQTLTHCQILAEANALWAVGLHQEAREHLRLLMNINGTMGRTKRLVTGF